MKLKFKVYDEDGTLDSENTEALNNTLTEDYLDNDLSVRMYSGRKDRNDKRIFESDRVTGTGVDSKVYFNNGAFRLKDVSGEPVLTKELVRDKRLVIASSDDEDDED